MPRLFAGIELDDATRSFTQRAAELVAASGVNGRFELPEKFHVTIAFLGTIAPERVDEVVSALRSASRMSIPFALRFDVIGAFPSDRRARVVWVGARKTPAAFSRCVELVFEALLNAGWALDRKPQPHVTICRVKERGRLELPRLTDSACLPVSGVTLWESRPAGPTTRYVELARLPFG